MANQLNISGNKFHLVLDDFLAGHDLVSNTTDLPDNMAALVENFIVTPQGRLRRRGGLMAEFPTIANAQSRAGNTCVVSYPNILFTGTQCPIFTLEDNGVGYTSTGGAATSRGTVASGGGTPSEQYRQHTMRQLVERAILIPTGSGSPVYTWGGNDEPVATNTSTGRTVTVTHGSKTITFSGALAGVTDLSGSHFITTSGGDAFAQVYHILSHSGTTATLDRTYVRNAGAGSDAGLSWRSSVHEIFRAESAVWNVSGLAYGAGAAYSQVNAFAQATWQNRLWFGNTTELPAGPPQGTGARLRWSGLIGSSEGYGSGALYRGARGFHVDGYLDLPPEYGDIIALVPFGNSMVCLQDRGMVVLFGSPNFNGTGSLDATARYDLPAPPTSGKHYCVTPSGLYFFVRGQGLFRFDGSGAPQKIASSDKIRVRYQNRWEWGIEYTRAGGSNLSPYIVPACNGRYLILSFNGSVQNRFEVYDTERDSWSSFVANNAVQVAESWVYAEVASKGHDGVPNRCMFKDDGGYLLSIDPAFDDPGHLDQAGAAMTGDNRGGDSTNGAFTSQYQSKKWMVEGYLFRPKEYRVRYSAKGNTVDGSFGTLADSSGSTVVQRGKMSNPGRTDELQVTVSASAIESLEIVSIEIFGQLVRSKRTS